MRLLTFFGTAIPVLSVLFVGFSFAVAEAKQDKLEAMVLWGNGTTIATDKQIDKLVELIHSNDPKTAQAAIEFVRGTMYLGNPRIQMAVLDLWDNYQFSNLVLEVLTEVTAIHPDALELMFEKSLVGKGGGGYSDDGRRRAVTLFEKLGSNDYTFFRRLLGKSIVIVNSEKYPNPNYGAEVSGFFFKTFKNLGEHASVLELFPVLQGIFAKIDAKYHRALADAVAAAFFPVQADEEQALFELFLTSNEKLGTTKENFAYWILSSSRYFRAETMVKLRDVSLRGTPELRSTALRMALLSLKPSEPAHLEFLIEFLKNPEVSEETKKQLFYVLDNFALGDSALALEVYAMALDYVRKSKEPYPALSTIFKNWKRWSESDFRLVLSLASNSAFPGNIKRNGVRLKLQWLREVLPLLRSQNQSERESALAFLEGPLDVKLYDLVNAQQSTLELVNFTSEACAGSVAEDVKKFCDLKIKASNEALLSSLTQAPPSVSLKFFREDATRALRKKPELPGTTRVEYSSVQFFDKVRRGPDFKWTVGEFIATWISFLTDQIQSGDPDLLKNSSAFFIRMTYIADPGSKNPFWNLNIGNNARLENVLKQLVLKGSPATAREALILMGQLLERTPEPIALDRWFLDRLHEGPQHVTAALMQNPFYISSYEPSDVQMIVAHAKGNNPELRGSAFNMLAYPQIKPKPMTTELENLVQEAQKSLLSSEAVERGWAIGLSRINDESLKKKIFTPEVIESYLKQFVASKQLFLQPDQPESIGRTYFVNSVADFVNVNRLGGHFMTSEQYPFELMRELIWAPDRKIAREAILGIGGYYAAVASKLPNKHYGTIQGTKEEMMIPKHLLEQFVKIAGRETDEYLIYVINLVATKSRQNFSIEKFRNGSLKINWEP